MGDLNELSSPRENSQIIKDILLGIVNSEKFR